MKQKLVLFALAATMAMAVGSSKTLATKPASKIGNCGSGYGAPCSDLFPCCPDGLAPHCNAPVGGGWGTCV